MGDYIGFHLSRKYTQLFTKTVQESRHYGRQTHFVCVSFFLFDFEQIYSGSLGVLKFFTRIFGSKIYKTGSITTSCGLYELAF